MRDPIYRSRPVAPRPARPGRHERVHDRVVMSEGFSNVYLIETDARSVMVNSGMGMEAPVHARNLDSYSPASVSHLVLTQGHVDHVGGVAYFRDRNPDLKVIAQRGNPEHQAYEAMLSKFRVRRSGFAFRDEIINAFKQYQAAEIERNPQDVPTPDVLFEEIYDFEVAGTPFRLIACPGAETNDSLIVWLPDDRICFTGNLFGCAFGHFPNLSTIRGDRYRDALVCADAAQTVLDLRPDLILYGHHAPIVGWDVIEAELIAFRDATCFVHDETVAGMNAGKDVHTLMREISLPPELEVGEGYGKVSWAVRSIWEFYSGWFHASSTTELYAVPPTAIHADLVDLAGAESLCDRAADHLAAGRVEEALLILDVVRGGDPEMPRARELARTAHEALLERSENMWLTRWLRHELEKLSS